MRQSILRPLFVEFIPEGLAEGNLYISERYRTAVHLCCCGCGEEVVTPLTPADWQVHRVGSDVTLHPSIGNWSFACKSHYWIKRNRVEWARPMTEQQIARVRSKDHLDKARYIRELNAKKVASATDLRVPSPEAPKAIEKPAPHQLWRALTRWLGM